MIGIDCSALVYFRRDEVFRLSLPPLEAVKALTNVAVVCQSGFKAPLEELTLVRLWGMVSESFILGHSREGGVTTM